MFLVIDFLDVFALSPKNAKKNISICDLADDVAQMSTEMVCVTIYANYMGILFPFLKSHFYFTFPEASSYII